MMWDVAAGVIIAAVICGVFALGIALMFTDGAEDNKVLIGACLLGSIIAAAWVVLS